MSHAASARLPLWRRLANMAFSSAVTIAVVAGAAVVVVTGADALSDRAAANATETSAPPTPVDVQVLKLETGFTLNRFFVGQVEAQRSVNLSFELAGKLDEVLVDEGQSVQQGQLLARLNTALIEAERRGLDATKNALQARLTYAEQTLDRATELNERGFASADRLDQAFATREELIAQLAEIAARQVSIRLQLEKSELYAPKSGRITIRNVDGGETLTPGQVILGLIDEASVQVRVGLPLDVPTDDLGQVAVDVEGHTYTATLQSIRPDIDAVTRTRTAIFSIDKAALDAAGPMIFGQTARISIERPVQTKGTWVQTRALKEAERGSWSVLVVDEDSRVRRAIVEVIHATGDQVYVRGTFPAGTRMIKEGPHRVSPGQLVQVRQEG